MTLTSLQMANRVQWVRDLISGQFEQGSHALKSTRDGKTYYCCLGVACERVNPAGSELRLHVHTPISSGTRSKGFLNPDTLDFLGLSYRDQNTAASWNDTYGLDFSRIADLIAWATQNEVEFADLSRNGTGFDRNGIPIGYANEWLNQFDSENDG